MRNQAVNVVKLCTATESVKAMVTVAPKYAVLPLMASAVQTQQATDALRLLVREVTTIMQNTGHLKFHFYIALTRHPG